jgi:putative ABC transport system permease protein
MSELWSDLRYRVRALVRRDAIERELDEELRFHLEHETEKYVTQGVPRAEAARLARLAFGGIERIKDDTRDVRGTAVLEHVVQDVRYALRGLRAHPGFTAVVVITLALGVGVNAAMFGVVDRLLIRPPAYLLDAPFVHRVYFERTPNSSRIKESRTEYPTYVDLARWSTSFSATAAFTYRDESVGSGEAVEERVVAAVSSSFFDFFSARPAVGRFFVPQEDVAPMGSPVVVLAYAYWQSRYGGATDALGASLRIGRETYSIIGVAPAGFEGVSDHRTPVAFVPITRYAASIDPTYARRYNWSVLQMLARRKPGVTLQAATTDLTNAYRRSWPGTNAALTSSADPTRAALTLGPIHFARGPHAGPDSRVVKWVSGVAVIVLLIACANVANLLLVRALRRRRELALRTSLGGTRLRVIQQLLTETLVLALLGGVAGLIAAQWGGGALRGLFLDATSPTDVLGDVRTLIFATAVTLGAALIAGVAPALQAGRVDLADSLKAGAREANYRRSRMRSALLVVQATLSVVLLVGAGLFVSSLQELRAVRLGYDVDPILYVHARSREATADAIHTNNVAFGQRLVEEALSIPGIARVTPVISVPFLGGESQTLHVAGLDSTRHLGRFSLQAGSPDYFATVGTRVLRGRGIEATDLENSPRVAVVSEAMARVLWPGRDAIGQCFRIRSDTVPCTTVVGVAEDVRMLSLTAGEEFHYYLPKVQHRSRSRNAGLELLIRVNGNAADFAEPVRRRLQRIMPGASYVNVVPLQQFVDPATRPWEFGATMFSAFGLLALLLAAIGLYAVIAFGVAQRTHELGVRIALGARRNHVLGLVVGEGLRLTLTGVLIGSSVALIASRWLAPLLFNVSPRDPSIYLLVAVILLAIGVLATALPALKATRVDPNLAFKVE